MAKDSGRNAILTMREANFYGERLRLLADIDDGGWIRCELLGKEIGANPYARNYPAEVAVVGAINKATDAVRSASLVGIEIPKSSSVSIHSSGWSEIRFGTHYLSSFGNMPLVLQFIFRNARLYALEGDLSIIRRN